MGIKSYIKAATIDKNVFWYDLACKKSEIKSELITRKTLKAVQGIDPILDYDSFKKAIMPYLEKKTYMAHWGWGAESRHYGHIEMLFEYAGMDKKPKAREFPAMEHAVSYRVPKVRTKEFIERCSNLIYQSKYKNKLIHEINPLKPIFYIGPYIHYAKSIYDEKKEAELKGKFGKTLVIFAGHHRETQTIEYSDKKFVKRVMDYAKENGFQTVLASVYFCDVDKALYEEFREQGAILVSAGFREDPLFIRRLKALFNLADMIMANTVGTPVGFSKFMDIPYQMVLEAPLEIEEAVYHAPIDFEHLEECFLRVEYLSSLSSLTEEQQQLYDDLYTFYSGEKELTRTPGEMRAILEICQEIVRISKGEFAQYDWAVKQLLDKYQKVQNLKKYELLCEAIDVEKVKENGE